MKKLLLLAVVGTTSLAMGILPTERALAQTKEKTDARPSPPQKIAVIDLERVFGESHQFQQMIEELKELKLTKEQKFQQMQQQKISLAQDVREQQLEIDSEEYLSKEEEAIRLESSAKIFAAVSKQQIGRRQLEIQAEMFSVVRKALDKFAESNGYSFVLNARELAEGSDNPNDLQRVMSQPVSWHRNREDITDAMIQYLNQKYDASADVRPVGGSNAGKPKATTADGTKAAAKPATGTKPASPTPSNTQPKRTAEAAPRKTTK
ncbi:MAG: OmpH family outer membrane protein [Planctomycetota bacterium]|nr:OmpH family outer membrane protein [Planctomycetota bacterium]